MAFWVGYGELNALGWSRWYCVFRYLNNNRTLVLMIPRRGNVDQRVFSLSNYRLSSLILFKTQQSSTSRTQKMTYGIKYLLPPMFLKRFGNIWFDLHRDFQLCFKDFPVNKFILILCPFEKWSHCSLKSPFLSQNHDRVNILVAQCQLCWTNNLLILWLKRIKSEIETSKRKQKQSR